MLSSRNLYSLIAGVGISLISFQGVCCAESFEHTLRDHVTIVDNWRFQPYSSLVYSSAPKAYNALIAVPIVGDGNRLKRIGGIFSHYGDNDPSALVNVRFRVNFYPSEEELKADPLNDLPSQANYRHLFSTPSNPDWLTKIDRAPSFGAFAPALDLYYWEFDVEFLGIKTEPGKTHYVSILGEKLNSEGVSINVSNSVFYPGAIGSQDEMVYLAINGNSIGPGTGQELGYPAVFTAHKITTASLPGDYNSDGAVNGADFLVWQRSFGSNASPAGSGADGNIDGTIDRLDYTIWLNNLGSTFSTEPPVGSLGNDVFTPRDATPRTVRRRLQRPTTRGRF